jgi:RNA polymerase sigma factor (sigma-70 family)
VRIDEAAVNGFVARDYAKVLAAVAMIVRDRAEAEDLVQDALARAWGRNDIDHLAAWVSCSAMNRGRGVLRRRLRRDRALARSFERPTSPPSVEASMDLRRALKTLTTREREATLLYYALDLSVRDVAASMSVSEGTVKVLLSRGRHKLAQSMAVDDDR